MIRDHPSLLSQKDKLKLFVRLRPHLQRGIDIVHDVSPSGPTWIAFTKRCKKECHVCVTQLLLFSNFNV